jgi:hypothetical protein
MLRPMIAVLALNVAAVALAPARAQDATKNAVRVIPTTRDAADTSKAALSSAKNPTIGSPPADIIDAPSAVAGSGDSGLLSNNPRFREAYMGQGDASIYIIEPQPQSQPAGRINASPSSRGGFLEHIYGTKRAK